MGFPIAVIYKFFDDSSNYLAAAVTYYAFVAIFPLLLIGSSILGFFLQNDGKLREQLLDTAIGSFPIIADQIESTEGLHGSTTAVVFGALVALYGVLGLGQSSQYAMNVAWAVPRNSRPNPFIGRGVSLVMLGFAGFALLVIAALTGFLSTNPWFDDQHSWAGLLVRGGTLVLSGAAFTVLFLLASARKHSFRSAAPGAFAVTGQTHSRKVDASWAATVAGVAQSAGKFSHDVRLLQHLGEVLEPFGASQVGSSAMPYKRNPMRAERIAGLARFVISLQANGAHTAASQWLERTLDDERDSLSDAGKIPQQVEREDRRQDEIPEDRQPGLESPPHPHRRLPRQPHAEHEREGDERDG